MIKNGLHPLPKDDRDLQLGSIFNLPDLSELPKEFIINLPKVKQQFNSDFCAAFSSCLISELQENVELCPEWTFAVAKSISGNVDNYGTDLRSICKAHQKFGAIELNDSPYSLEKGQSSDFLRRIENWPKDLFNKALVHRKQSYFSVTGPYDHFDNIRATMWKFKDEKCGVLFGVLWAWSLSDVLVNTVKNNGSGHALAQIGFSNYLFEGHEIPTIFVQNSFGTETGLNGRHYFTREVINAFVDKYGAFMFHDMPVDQARNAIKYNLRENDDWIDVFVKKCFFFLKNQLSRHFSTVK